MAEPWFEPKGVLRFRALTWQGTFVQAATYLAMGLGAVAAFFFTDPESVG